MANRIVRNPGRYGVEYLKRDEFWGWFLDRDGNRLGGYGFTVTAEKAAKYHNRMLDGMSHDEAAAARAADEKREIKREARKLADKWGLTYRG